MWGTIKKRLARFAMVPSLDTDKIRCRWRRSSLENVMLAAGVLSRHEVNRDLARPYRGHDQPQRKNDGYSWTRQGGRIYPMMSVFSWR